MLWSEENFTENLDDLQHHKDLVKKLKKINKNNLQNMFFYGGKGCGKNTLVKLLLKKIFKSNSINLTPVTLLSEIYFLRNNFYYYIDILLLGKKPHNIFPEFIESIINTKNINNYFQCFVFVNIEHASINFMRYIKYYLDKKSYTSRFIFISSIVERNYISDMLKSFCLPIKVRQLYKKELISILENKKNKNKIVKFKTYDSICNFSKNNLTKSIFLLQLRCHNVYEFNKYKKRERKFYDVLYKIIMKEQIDNISKIRYIIYKIVIKNVDEKLFIRKFICHILEKIHNLETINKILSLSTKTTKYLSNTSKEIIIMEGFFVKLMKILYDSLQTKLTQV